MQIPLKSPYFVHLLVIMYLFDTIRRFDCFNATNYQLKATSEQDAEFISAMNDPELKAKSAKTAMLFSRTNTLLSLPMLLTMVAAQNLY